MAKHFENPSAVVVALFRENEGRCEVLLQKRANTGFADGLWDLSCSGHVEFDENAKLSAVREIKEELGVSVREYDLSFFALIHKRDRDASLTYYNLYFKTDKFIGSPKICEPNKCSDLRWFPLDSLPTDLIDDRRRAIDALLSGDRYIEYGW